MAYGPIALSIFKKKDSKKFYRKSFRYLILINFAVLVNIVFLKYNIIILKNFLAHLG